MSNLDARQRAARVARSRRIVDEHVSEDQLQRAVIKHLELRAPSDVFYFHVPNEGMRSKIEAARQKAIGLVPGVLDLVIVRSGRMFALELKARGKKPSPEQLAVMHRLRAAGVPAEWSDNLDGALAHLNHWGIFERRRMALSPDEDR